MCKKYPRKIKKKERALIVKVISQMRPTARYKLRWNKKYGWLFDWYDWGKLAGNYVQVGGYYRDADGKFHGGELGYD